ncbi:MAG: hypothetical protein WAQ98_13460 [Blastocatellia bacterium]
MKNEVDIIKKIKAIKNIDKRYLALMELLESSAMSNNVRKSCVEIALDILEEIIYRDYLLEIKAIDEVGEVILYKERWRILPFLNDRMRENLERMFYEEIKQGKISTKRFEGSCEANILNIVNELVKYLVYVKSEKVQREVRMNIYASTNLVCRFGDKNITDSQYLDLLDLLIKNNLRSNKLEKELVGIIKSNEYRLLGIEKLAAKPTTLEEGKKLSRQASRIRKQQMLSNCL